MTRSRDNTTCLKTTRKKNKKNAAPPKADGETAEEYETHINITQKKGKGK